MPAKKSAKSGAKKSAKKGAKRSVKKSSTHRATVIDHGATLSPYGKSVLRVFRDGVQHAYAKMANAGVSATVVVNGEVVRAVPHREGGRFVVTKPAAKQASTRHRVR
jgi:hypothetical protein